MIDRAASRFQVDPVRGSFIKAIAYAAGLKLLDERTGIVWDYTHRRLPGRDEVIRFELFLPGDRDEGIATFCNRLNQHNKHYMAVPGRVLILSGSRALSNGGNWRAMSNFASLCRDTYQIGVFLSLHAARPTDVIEPSDEEEFETVLTNGNVHGHLYFTYCQVAADGTLGTKVVALDPRSAATAHLPNFCSRMRAVWAACLNKQLEAEGCLERVDLRTLQAQGIFDEPTIHEGLAVSALERRGQRTDRGDANRAIRQRNAGRQRFTQHIELVERVVALIAAALTSVRASPTSALALSRKSMNQLRRAIWRRRRDLRVRFVSRRFGVVAMNDGSAAVLSKSQLIISAASGADAITEFLRSARAASAPTNSPAGDALAVQNVAHAARIQHNIDVIKFLSVRGGSADPPAPTTHSDGAGRLAASAEIARDAVSLGHKGQDSERVEPDNPPARPGHSTI